MCDLYPGIKLRTTTEETDGGFTLLEVLIVIVVLGILAAVVIFALGSRTRPRSRDRKPDANRSTPQAAGTLWRATLAIVRSSNARRPPGR